MNTEVEEQYGSGIICPHCKHEHIPGDGPYEEGSWMTMECWKCEEEFDVLVEYSASYTTRAAK